MRVHVLAQNKIVMTAVLVFFIVVAPDRAQAQNLSDSFGSVLHNIVDAGSGYTDTADPSRDLPLYIGGLFAWVGVLGLIMVAQLALAGYEYMTSNGDPEKVTSAKKRIRNAIIAAVILVGGLIIATMIIAIWQGALNAR